MRDLATRLRDCYCPDDTDEATCREAAELIANLPKTKDGVPVIPDIDIVYAFIPELKEVRATSDTNGSIARFLGEWNTVSFVDVLLEECFSSREAAKAAKAAVE